MDKNQKKRPSCKIHGKTCTNPKCQQQKIQVLKHFEPCKKGRRQCVDDDFPDFLLEDVESFEKTPKKRNAKKKPATQSTNSSDASLRRSWCSSKCNGIFTSPTECSGLLQGRKANGGKGRERKKSSISANSSDGSMRRSWSDKKSINSKGKASNDFTAPTLAKQQSHLCATFKRNLEQMNAVGNLRLTPKDLRCRLQDKINFENCNVACPLKVLEPCSRKREVPPPQSPSVQAAKCKRILQNEYLQQLKKEIICAKPLYSTQIKKTASELKSEIAKYRETLNRNVNILQERLGPNFYRTAGSPSKQKDICEPSCQDVSQLTQSGDPDKSQDKFKEDAEPIRDTNVIKRSEGTDVTPSPPKPERDVEVTKLAGSSKVLKCEQCTDTETKPSVCETTKCVAQVLANLPAVRKPTKPSRTDALVQTEVTGSLMLPSKIGGERQSFAGRKSKLQSGEFTPNFRTDDRHFRTRSPRSIGTPAQFKSEVVDEDASVTKRNAYAGRDQVETTDFAGSPINLSSRDFGNAPLYTVQASKEFSKTSDVTEARDSIASAIHAPLPPELFSDTEDGRKNLITDITVDVPRIEDEDVDKIGFAPDSSAVSSVLPAPIGSGLRNSAGSTTSSHPSQQSASMVQYFQDMIDDTNAPINEPRSSRDSSASTVQTETASSQGSEGSQPLSRATGKAQVSDVRSRSRSREDYPTSRMAESSSNQARSKYPAADLQSSEAGSKSRLESTNRHRSSRDMSANALRELGPKSYGSRNVSAGGLSTVSETSDATGGKSRLSGKIGVSDTGKFRSRSGSGKISSDRSPGRQSRDSSSDGFKGKSRESSRSRSRESSVGRTGEDPTVRNRSQKPPGVSESKSEDPSRNLKEVAPPSPIPEVTEEEGVSEAEADSRKDRDDAGSTIASTVEDELTDRTLEDRDLEEISTEEAESSQIDAGALSQHFTVPDESRNRKNKKKRKEKKKGKKKERTQGIPPNRWKQCWKLQQRNRRDWNTQVTACLYEESFIKGEPEGQEEEREEEVITQQDVRPAIEEFESSSDDGVTNGIKIEYPDVLSNKRPREEEEPLESRELNLSAANGNTFHETSAQMKDECEVYGELLAIKLKKFDDRTRITVMHEIDNIIFRTRMNYH